MSTLERALREQNAVIGDDADKIAPDAREARDQGFAVERLELVEFAAVDDTRDHLAHVIGFAAVGWYDAVKLLGRIKRLLRRLTLDSGALGAVEIADDAPHQFQRLGIVLGDLVGDTRLPRMDLGA